MAPKRLPVIDAKPDDPERSSWSASADGRRGSLTVGAIVGLPLSGGVSSSMEEDSGDDDEEEEDDEWVVRSGSAWGLGRRRKSVAVDGNEK